MTYETMKDLVLFLFDPLTPVSSALVFSTLLSPTETLLAEMKLLSSIAGCVNKETLAERQLRSVRCGVYIAISTLLTRFTSKTWAIRWREMPRERALSVMLDCC